MVRIDLLHPHRGQHWLIKHAARLGYGFLAAGVVLSVAVLLAYAPLVAGGLFALVFLYGVGYGIQQDLGAGRR